MKTQFKADSGRFNYHLEVTRYEKGRRVFRTDYGLFPSKAAIRKKIEELRLAPCELPWITPRIVA